MDQNQHSQAGGKGPAPAEEEAESMNQYESNPTAPNTNPPNQTVGVPVPSPYPGGNRYDRQCRKQLQQDQMRQRINSFWARQLKEIEESTDLKSHSLPLSRIKKIMKFDEDVKMVSTEATMLLAKACELFIMELTMRAWANVEDDKRKIIQKTDIASAISMSDMFDFLVDTVPRDDTVTMGHQLLAGIAPTPNENAPYPYMSIPHHVAGPPPPYAAPTNAPEDAANPSCSNSLTPNEQDTSNSDDH
ncbi:hypothetical protein VNO80_29046 [Phaseolus coccineus]|uniref:Core Histone H2A/H2B/H3 domain-containing protein n=1 Tax=Phaseolus coccineus TaxID=3886 RepID=A0AAN9LAP7_PHACN